MRVKYKFTHHMTIASVNLVQDTKDTKRHVVQIPMDLTRDIEFKFIVDGEWRYATDLPHRKDWRKSFIYCT